MKKSRWDVINESLLKPILSSEELEKAILSYNIKYKGRWRFNLLHSFFNDVNFLFYYIYFVCNSNTVKFLYVVQKVLNG